MTPSKKAKEKDINLLQTFWEKVGSKVDIMQAKQHDYILSITSHIPHLIAYNIVNTSLNIQDEKESNIVKYSAGGLRDFTRIAASNPIMWRDVFIQNKKNTSKMIDKFIRNLEDLKKVFRELKKFEVELTVVFLKADIGTLLKRFNETRRRHPLSKNGLPLKKQLSKRKKDYAQFLVMLTSK